MSSTPKTLSASTTALITAGGDPMAPTSPHPFTPSELWAQSRSGPNAETGQIIGTWHRVIHEGSGHELTIIIIDAAFQCLANTLGHATMIWPCTIIGLITRPTSSTPVMFTTSTTPVSGSISTSQI